MHAAVTALHKPHSHQAINNRLLLAFPRSSLDRVLSVSEPVSLSRGQQLYRAEQPLTYLYFINRGLACIFKTMEDGRTVEIEAIGVDDVVDALFLIGAERAVLDTVVQIPGTAIRMRRDVLMKEMENERALHQLLSQYARLVCSRVTRTIGCNRLHHLEQRCCLWLLIAHNNALSNTFPLTHEFLAMMLGYQRAGVSIAMNSLARVGYIEQRRGMVTITNRPGLEAAACECYGAMQNELDELIPRAKQGMASRMTG